MAENQHGVTVGDVFVESWGYDQTNVDYYQVIRTTKAMVELREIGAETVGNGHGTRLMPAVDQFKQTPNGGHSRTLGKTAMKKTKSYDDGFGPRVYVTMSSYSSAHLWDRESSHFDTIAAGYPGH